MKQIRITTSAAATMLALAGSAGVHAMPLTNGGFETAGSGAQPLDSWIADNDSGPNPPSVFQKSSELFRDGLPMDDDFQIWEPLEGEFFASLWSTDTDGNSLASLSQTFNARAGDILEFSYFFDVSPFNENLEGGDPRFDGAVGALADQDGRIVPDGVLFQYNLPNSDLPNNENIGSRDIPWTNVDYTLPADGEYTLLFAVADASGSFESILGVDAVSVIPSPGASALLALSGLACLRRRRAA